jgi:GT2 family glycosyltransferase
MDDFDYQKEAEVDQVIGAALLTRRQIIEKLGFFDEKFWLWYEEVDFCKRVRDAGYEIRYFPGAEVMHRGAESFAKLAVYIRKRTAGQSLKYYFQKHGNFFEVLMIRLVLPLVLAAAWLVQRLEKLVQFKIRTKI